MSILHDLSVPYYVLTPIFAESGTQFRNIRIMTEGWKSTILSHHIIYIWLHICLHIYCKIQKVWNDLIELQISFDVVAYLIWSVLIWSNWKLDMIRFDKIW